VLAQGASQLFNTMKKCASSRLRIYSAFPPPIAMALNANGWASSVEAPTITFEVVAKAVIPYGTRLLKFTVSPWNSKSRLEISFAENV
jgi:hypothetical protein